MPGSDLRSGSPKDDFLGTELIDTVIAPYHGKHKWGDGAVKRSASPLSPLATYGKVEFWGYSSGLQSPREQDTQPSSSSLKGVHCHRPSQAGWRLWCLPLLRWEWSWVVCCLGIAHGHPWTSGVCIFLHLVGSCGGFLVSKKKAKGW